MKISRNATENIVPEWFGKAIVTEPQILSTEAIKRLASKSSINDEDMVIERDRIEKCASTKNNYYFNNKWGKKAESELREYACICGLDKEQFKAVDIDNVKEDKESEILKEAEAELNKLTKTAAKQTLTLDAFDFETKINTDHMKKSDWQKISNASKLNEKPIILNKAIVSVRGGDDYNANPEFKESKTNNSILAPDSIKTFAESKEEDTGSRLRRENKEKEMGKKARHENWQNEKIANMPDRSMLPKGNIFPTEAMNAQPGLNTPSSAMGVYAKFNLDSIPEKTEGEMIKAANESRRKNIQGEAKEKHVFTTQKESSVSISDSFAEELKKHLK